MLSRTSFAFILASLGIAAFSSGCIIVGTDNGNTGGSSNVGVGGSGGSSVDTTTTTGTTTTSTGTGGSGGAGGGGMCIGADDGTKDAASCKAMNITPSSEGGPATLCQASGQTYNPPGYDLCNHAFTIYTKGAASYLQECLAAIGVEPSNACDQAQVDKCATGVFPAVCPNATAASTCDTIGASCTAGGQMFDTQLCQTELNPFNDKAITELVNCINQTDPNVECQVAYDECYAKATSY